MESGPKDFSEEAILGRPPAADSETPRTVSAVSVPQAVRRGKMVQLREARDSLARSPTAICIVR